MSRAAFIENVAKKGNMSKAESKRMVDLVLGEIETGLKKSKKEGRYTIGNFGTFTIARRPGAQGPQSADGRSDPDQGLQGSEVPAGDRAEEGGGCLIPWLTSLTVSAEGVDRDHLILRALR